MLLLFSSSLSLLRRNPDKLFLIPALLASRARPASRSSMAPPNVIPKYAKFGRSSLMSCFRAIPAGELPLGYFTKDLQQFNLVRRLPLTAVGIVGFSSLKGHDKDALRKLGTSASSNQITEEAGSYSSTEHKHNCLQMDFCISDAKAKYEHFCFTVMDYQAISSCSVLVEDATLPPKWKAIGTVIFCEKEDGLHDSEKVAAFDFDGCLANTSVRRIGSDAWSLMYPSIPKKLQELYNKGYKLVIFTNESNIERWKNKRQLAVDSKIGRLENFIKCVKLPIQVFIACGLGRNKDQNDDPFRKPQPGMWKLMEENFNSGIKIDMDQSFYVGDAAGRTDDHSDADVTFAQVI
ncbi:hypothetical protein C4D60_Mb01t33300 [Musa balbisiana]|uniref:Uncharacterized protein n=1 Tax=Musa balbisiana TaxID=52838 RepID=A0A4S8JSH9_MUSBA|nr:hypothetical protein C4D60_Mb01t33300 [Musa balbisiana]